MKEPEIDDLKEAVEGFPAPRSRRRTRARPVAGDASAARPAHVTRALVGLGLARDPCCRALLFPGNHSALLYHL